MKHRMFKRIRRSLAELRRSTSGNAAILVAAGMPALVGGAGLAVDTAQWYMWKREMQYAVDQAAIAGAWSKVKGSEGTEYQTRALQELNANIQIVDFHGTPTVALADYAQAAEKTDNSVVVTLSATKTLPFTSILTNEGATVSVRAQAYFQQGQTFTSCLIAVDPDTKGAIIVAGSAYVVAKCGAAALSDDEEAIVNDGNAVFDVGWIVSSGGIDDDFNDDEGTQVYENQTGLVDPFADLIPPDSPGAQTYTCITGHTYTATYTATTVKTTKTYEGTDTSNLTLVSSMVASTGIETLTKEVGNGAKVGDTVSVTSGVGTVTGTPVPIGTVTVTTGNGKNAVTTTATNYRRIDTVTTASGVITAIADVYTEAGANTVPGTYSDFTITCDTVMAKGIYVIDGGMFKTNANYSLMGDGVMIVLKNGAGIQINGNSNTLLEAMTFEEMRTFGNLTEEQAIELKDMLVFEDPDSEGDDLDKINGTSGTILGGTVYLPRSTLTFNGTADISSDRCLVIATQKIVIGGDTNMTSFCDENIALGPSIGGGATSVRLVA